MSCRYCTHELPPVCKAPDGVALNPDTLNFFCINGDDLMAEYRKLFRHYQVVRKNYTQLREMALQLHHENVFMRDLVQKGEQDGK
jgi:hypothetical protein